MDLSFILWKTCMKNAFVNCWIAPGGVLNVFVDLLKSHKATENDKIFTIFSKQKSFNFGSHEIKIVTALPNWINSLFVYFWKNKVFLLSSIFDYRNLMLFYPLMMNILSWKIKRFGAEKVYISSFAIAKNLSFCREWYTGKYKPYTELYLHSPMQYIRSHRKEYTRKLKWFKWWIFRNLVSFLQKRDLKYKNYDKVFSNSKYTAGLAKNLYWFESEIKYPKVSESFFKTQPNLINQGYYVFVGRLVKFVKECDLIIEAFNKIGKPLIMIGAGPDELYLKSIANDNIIFVGWIDDVEEKMKIISRSKWMINITKESFGLWTVESLLLWVPVLGYWKGATLELVDKKSGVLLYEKNVEKFIEAFEKFDEINWEKEEIINSIRKKLDEYKF